MNLKGLVSQTILTSITIKFTHAHSAKLLVFIYAITFIISSSSSLLSFACGIFSAFKGEMWVRGNQNRAGTLNTGLARPHISSDDMICLDKTSHESMGFFTFLLQNSYCIIVCWAIFSCCKTLTSLNLHQCVWFWRVLKLSLKWL